MSCSCNPCRCNPCSCKEDFSKAVKGDVSSESAAPVAPAKGAPQAPKH